jgi:hypothetical protein
MQILLLLIVVALIVFLVVNRKRGSSGAKAQPTPPAAKVSAAPSEQYGPSVDELEQEEPSVDADPEPVVEIEPEPVLEIEPEPVVEIVREDEPEPFVEIVREPEPVVDVAPPVVAMQPEPFAAQAVIEAEPTVEPEPVAELQHESVIEVVHVEPEPVVDVAPEPVAEVAPEPAVETQTEPEPVLEISYPDIPTDDAPPGLSLDAFKDIKPVAFGGVQVEETEPASSAEPETEPVVAPEPVVEFEPEPFVEAEPEPAFEPLSYPVESEPVIEPEPELPVAAAVAEPAVADEPKPKKRGFRLPNPQMKLPSFGKKQKAAPAVAVEGKPETKPKTKGGLKLPQITLPSNLQGALTDVERKIVLGSIVAIVAAGAFGYATAPTEDAAAPAPTPAPATPTP